MVLKIPEYWGVAVDGLQIVLCFLILVFLIRFRTRHKQSSMKDTQPNSTQGFNMQVFTLAVKQQVDQAFANICKSIDVERRNLENMLPLSHQSRAVRDTSGSQPRSHPSQSHTISRTSGENATSGERHAQIQKLATKGMSVRQISETLKISRGEVELIMSLEK